ncbi:hypothetical protein [Chitinophaga qingshengii]|uniref:Uncharacterized protein n=1 Tax=Chitinophaga qingshengii TaxID=1569794 RepID=A0ABR7TLV4_9BACT|nr:hypothetical protein [Chitinophaga qingshengii]MBC9930404.1 hypothetical protein [Chitinophaga qingshengii]
MKWIRLLALIVFIGCVHKDEVNTSIYDGAFALSLPPGVKASTAPRTIYGDDILYWNIFNNEDSTIKVDVEISKDTTPLYEALIPYHIKGLQHFDPTMVVLNKEIRKQRGVEMLLIMYEIPLVRNLPGFIVERRVFLTPKGRATVDVTCRFDHLERKEMCINLVGEIGKSINTSTNRRE